MRRRRVLLIVFGHVHSLESLRRLPSRLPVA